MLVSTPPRSSLLVRRPFPPRNRGISSSSARSPRTAAAASGKEATDDASTTSLRQSTAPLDPDWRTKTKPVAPGSSYPAKEHCSQCGLCDTYFVAHVKEACAFLGEGNNKKMSLRLFRLLLLTLNSHPRFRPLFSSLHYLSLQNKKRNVQGVHAGTLDPRPQPVREKRKNGRGEKNKKGKYLFLSLSLSLSRDPPRKNKKNENENSKATSPATSSSSASPSTPSTPARNRPSKEHSGPG